MNKRSINETTKERKTEALVNLLMGYLPALPGKILVVGCGSGREAGMLARAFGAETIGIDVGGEFQFDHRGSEPAKLMIMDARNLEFPDHTFDFVFSFHALEHIPEPERALSEMKRVLRPSGHYLIGTPNKSRLVGYIGSASPLRYRVWWNVKDIWMRITGRWSNEAGAHAGFQESELRNLCFAAFGQAEVLSDRYYRILYSKKNHSLDLIIRAGLKNRLFPAVYIGGAKQPTSSRA